MIKLGVTSLSGLYRHNTQFGQPRHASVLLLRDLATAPEADGWYDWIVTQIRMPNGTSRQTQRDRFKILDPLIRDILFDRFRAQPVMCVTDCGVSTGATAVELYRILSQVFLHLEFVVTDLSFTAIVVKSRRWPVAVVFESGGCELQIICGPLVLPGRGRISPVYPLNRLARRIARETLVPRARSVLQRAGIQVKDERAQARLDSYDIDHVPLLCQECVRLTQTSANFRCEVDDVFQPRRRQAHLVRVMNVLTRCYFDDRSLRQAFRATLDNVLPGGLLVAGRSPNSDPRDLKATIFSREGNGLTIVSRLNGGCEEEDLILSAADDCYDATPRQDGSTVLSTDARPACSSTPR